MKRVFVVAILATGKRTRHNLVSSQVIDGVVTLLFLLPEGEVLLEELDDALGVTEVVLLELINLVESLLEGVVSDLASLGVILEDFVVEDREVKGETKLDGVASGKVDLIGLFVGFLGLLLDILELSLLGVLGDVAVVISDHLDEESLGFVGAGLFKDAVVDHVDDLLAVSHELGLNLALVFEEVGVELRVLGVLLDGRDGAASGSLGRDKVLEGDGKEVALVGVDGAALLGEDILEEVDHIVEALGLLSDTGEENLAFNLRHSKNCGNLNYKTQ